MVNCFQIDYRDFPFPNEMWIRKPDWEVGLKGTAFLVMIILGVVGNALLLSVVLRNRAIRTPTNLLIANMAVADLATLLLLPWIFLCIDCALLLTGVLNLVAVSYDRLTAIITPMDGRLTVHSTHIVMIFTWLTGLMLGLPLIFLRIYREREWKNFYEIYCTENSVIMPIYWYVVVIFVVWLPLIVMTFCYTRLFVKVC
ncbi:hypothetical protein C0J52_13715 [Blattella germanica]|nr:hypothetical protein C0J52_13715 [Blattella germanica]